jgi:hypothetical protein
VVKSDPVRIVADESMAEFCLDKMPMLSESPTEMDPSFVWSFSSDEDEGPSNAKDAVVLPVLVMMESPKLNPDISASRRLVISRRHQQYEDFETMFEYPFHSSMAEIDHLDTAQAVPRLDNASLFLRNIILDDPQSPKKSFVASLSPSGASAVDSPEGTIASSVEKEEDDLMTNPREVWEFVFNEDSLILSLGC